MLAPLDCTYLDIQIIHVIEKILDSIFLAHIMQHDESYMYGKSLKKISWHTLFSLNSVTNGHIV